MDDFKQYFNRQIQLLGDDTHIQLQKKKILIVGCGGLGCSLGVALGSSGIGQIDLVDFDTVSVTNIHRQIVFTPQDIGKKKCDILKKNIISRCPYTKVESFDMGLEEFIALDEIDKTYDLILDATDNLPIRTIIDKLSKSLNIPWIYGSVEAFHGQVCFFDKVSFDAIFSIQEHKVAGIATPIVMNIASLQANLALRFLANLSIKKNLLYYCFFSSDGLFETQKFNLL